MKRIWTSLIYLYLCCVVLGKYRRPSYLPAVAESTNKFAYDLHRSLRSTGNVVFSPWSIAFTMGMIMLGSAGETLQELQHALSLDRVDPESIYYGFKQLREHLARRNDDYEMNMFSTILIEENHNISPVYKLRLQRYFDAHIHETSFSKHGELVTEWINSWTSLKTGGKIKNVMTTEPDKDTIMMLLTTNYFKGVWEDTFDRNRTTSRTFTNYDGSISDVDMMFAIRNMTVYSGDEMAVEVVDIPMKGDISFLVVMPESPKDFQILQQNISASFFNTLYRSMSEETVELGLPKFKASGRTELQENFQELGVRRLFSYTDADLSGISNSGGLAVQEIIHKAALEVDEEGAVATSITVVSIISRKVYKLHFDRPFMYFIRDNKSGIILFMGQIAQL